MVGRYFRFILCPFLPAGRQGPAFKGRPPRAGLTGHLPVKGDALVKVPLETIARGSPLVPLNHPLMKSARSVGTSFGD
jgi:hypothetical protein